MSGVKRRYQGVPVMQLAIEDYPANNLPKVQEIILEQKNIVPSHCSFFLNSNVEIRSWMIYFGSEKFHNPDSTLN